MKKIVFILFFSLFFSISKSEDFKAFTVKFNGDTLTTTISFTVKPDETLLSSFYLSKNIKYTVENGKSKVFSPQNFYYFQFYDKGERLEFYSLNNYINDTKSFGFFHLVNNHKSHLRVFEHYEKEVNGYAAPGDNSIGASLAKGNFKKSYLIEREDGKLFFLFWKSFKRDLKNAVLDNPDLIKKIEDGAYTYENIPAIVDEYNKWYDAK